MIERIVTWLENKLIESKAGGFVLGLSGGLDSAVVGALCKKASNNTTGLILPCYSNDQDRKDAILVSSSFNIEVEVFDLCKVFDTFPLSFQIKLTGMNVKSRLRMVTLYAYANEYNRLVVGTGNRTERVLGYFTKHGDGGADILPIGDLTKAEVKELARDLKVPQSIIDKAPSAGLWDGQTDEEEIGASYEEMDYFISGLEVHDDNKRQKLLNMALTAKHKITPIPIFLK